MEMSPGITRMKLATRIIVGWVAALAGGVTLAFEVGPWCFFAALALSDWLRTGFAPRIPRGVERRRRGVLLPLAVLYFGLVVWLDGPESATHPVHVAGGIGFAVAIAWLIRDDIGVCRQLHATHAA
jgi:hypothetical protein